MASSNLRKEVLNTFKLLHRTRMRVFDGDKMALNFARDKINEEYKRNKNIQELHQISEKVELAKSVEVELRTTIIQAKEVKPGIYEAKLNSDTIKLDNVPFKDCDTQIEFSTKKKSRNANVSTTTSCCQEQKQ